MTSLQDGLMYEIHDIVRPLCGAKFRRVEYASVVERDCIDANGPIEKSRGAGLGRLLPIDHGKDA